MPKALDSYDYIRPPHLSEDQVRGLWNTLADANALLHEIVLLRQKNPGSDLISAMISARVPDGSAIGPGAVVRHSLSLIGAGYDTTATLLAHLVLHFTRNPD